MKQHYKTLEVEETSTQEEIKKAYRRLSKEWHPDKNQENIPESEKKIKEINQAYAILGDQKKRTIYDKYGIDTSTLTVAETARVEILEVFKQLMRVDFKENTLFLLAHNSVKMVLDNTKMEKEHLQEEINVIENRLKFIKKLLLVKVKPSMDILLKAVMEEIAELEDRISKINIPKLDFEIAVQKEALKILKSEYPEEKERIEKCFMSNRFMLKNTITTAT